MDDGARSLEDSIAMLRMAAAAGTTDLVATPHANLKYRFEPDVIRERLQEIAAASGNAIRLYSGCDFHLSFENIEDALANPRKYAIHHNRYLLVEFSDLLIFKNTQEIFARLMDAGMIPVITHPERNGLLRQRLPEIEAWIESGARVQITAQSLLGGFGRRAQEFTETLLEKNLAHFVASDGHDVKHRPPVLDAAYAELKKRHGEAMAETLCVTNPRAALSGDPVELPEAKSEASSRRWYQLWR